MLTLLVAFAVPIVVLLELIRLVLSIRALERSRDELIDLNAQGGRSAVRET